ncbi:MAPEG family protein [Thalassovita aquimarina]|uniref:MAPEG family protein n=1 Tax=Thalassovita aquimarina TaxID=2785917 RepID=A0ABS5HSW8_9RHOB|nr:MAPEG family protein [Thalassovita aquimarina]MBR9652082.1 MAPEG family protein [Thalassovita aquimarina]
MLTITAIYASLLALLFILLSVNVIRWRLKARVSVGDGGHHGLVKAIRCQANCAEYAPIGILLLGIAELQGAPVWAMHVLGAMLLGGRILHAFGFGRQPQIVPFRRLGILLTLIMITVAALGILGHALI